MSAPWYAHLLTGCAAILAGLALVRLGDATTGTMLVGSGVTFLGVGAGVATAWPTSSVAPAKA